MEELRGGRPVDLEVEEVLALECRLRGCVLEVITEYFGA